MKMNHLGILIFVSLFLTVYNQLDKNNYGPYNFSYENLTLCKGPKRGECGNVYMDPEKNPQNLVFHLNMTKDCPLSGAKIVIFSKQKNNTTKKLFNYVVNKPCEHFVLGPLLAEALNVTSPCKINKGYYQAHVNYEEKSKLFLSPSFFYGTYTFKVMIHNKVDNLMCFLSVLEVVKK